MDLTGWGGARWFHQTPVAGFCENGNLRASFMKDGDVLLTQDTNFSTTCGTERPGQVGCRVVSADYVEGISCGRI